MFTYLFICNIVYTMYVTRLWYIISIVYLPFKSIKLLNTNKQKPLIVNRWDTEDVNFEKIIIITAYTVMNESIKVTIGWKATIQF